MPPVSASRQRRSSRRSDGGKPKKSSSGGGGESYSRTAAIAIGATAVVAALFYGQSGKSAAAVADYDRWLTSQGIRRSRAAVACGGGAAASGGDPEVGPCRLVAKGSIAPGERVARVPHGLLQDASRLLKGDLAALAWEDGTVPAWRETLAARKTGSLWQSFVMAFWLWQERRKGYDSPQGPWFAVLPQQPETPAAWAADDAKCLDPFSAAEVDGVRDTVTAFSAAAATACATVPQLDCAGVFGEDGKSAPPEWHWAFHTLRQRRWGPAASPMIAPLVDLAVSHPELCAPSAGGGQAVQCDRSRRKSIHHDVVGTSWLDLLAAAEVPDGEPLYFDPLEKSPWSALSVWGYTDYASDWLPDLGAHAQVGELGLEWASLSENHPLAACRDPQALAFHHGGQPRPALRDCRFALLHAAKFPAIKSSTVDKRVLKELSQWKKDKANKLRAERTVWEQLRDAARSIATVVREVPPGCSSENATARRAVASATRQLILLMAEAAERHADRRWAAADARVTEAAADATGTEAEDASGGARPALTKADLLARAVAAQEAGEDLTEEELGALTGAR